MDRKKIGEGGYGCVFKPSMHCETPPKNGFNYDGYVSKIMTTKNAKTEAQEFEIIGALDPTNEYHMGKPILCRPKLSEPNVIEDISQCKHILATDVETHPDIYSLLVLKDGGPDLKSLCIEHLSKYLATNNQHKTDLFWLEVHHLIRGLKFFKDNGLVHNDLKPQNILFDLNNGSLKFIDFGLMKYKNDIIRKSKTSTNGSAIFHWTYPFGCGFMNKNEFEKYKKSKHKGQIKMALASMIIGNSKANKYKFRLKKPEAFKVLFTYLNPDNLVPDVETQYGYINSFFDGFNDLISQKNYDYILNHIVDSIDVFGLGFTLQYMTNCFKRHNALSLEDYTRLSGFFQKMYDFNPFTRTNDIEQLLEEYENILLQNGVLVRLNKSFENHKLVDKNPVPSPLSVITRGNHIVNKPLSANPNTLTKSSHKNKQLITRRRIRLRKQQVKSKSRSKSRSKSKSKSRSKSRSRSRSRSKSRSKQ